MTPMEKLFYGSLAVVGLLIIAGCSAGKALYDACREGLCR